MAWFLYLVGAAWIAVGCCVILYTGETRKMCDEFLTTTHHKMVSILPFVVGMFFIISASASSHPWLIGLLGFLGIIKAALLFLNPKGQVMELVHWFFKSVSDQGHRFAGIITIILGTAVLSWIV